MKTFDQWWSEYWKPTTLPPVFDAGMRELAQAAWDASRGVTRPDRVEWVREYRNKHGSTLYEALNEYYRTFP